MTLKDPFWNVIVQIRSKVKKLVAINGLKKGTFVESLNNVGSIFKKFYLIFLKQ